MRNDIKKTAFAALFALAAAPSCALADTGDIVFSLDTGTGTETTFGSTKVETYDVAVMLTGRDLRGKTVKQFTVPFTSKADATALKVWLSTKLDLQTIGGKKTNVPDLLTQDAEVNDDNVTVTLAEPYTITADTIYVGYTFTAVKNDGVVTPAVVLTSQKADGGFFVHSSSTYRKWLDYSAKGSSALKVLLGNASAEAASFTGPLDVKAKVGTDAAVTLSLANYGYNGVQSVDCEYAIDGQKGTTHIDLDNPLPPIYAASGKVTVTLPVPAAKGNYPASLAVTAINGNKLAQASTVSGSMLALNALPVKRAVVEEYTGTWCGFCPRGLVGLEVMKRLYPDDFIGISYHNGDPMEIMPNLYFPSLISGYPAAYLDRDLEVDAYYGSGNNGFGIDKDWEEACSVFVPVAMEAKAKLSPDGKKLNIDADLEFVADVDTKGYSLEFVVVSDSLHGTTSDWEQSNYYTKGTYGTASTFPEPEFEQFYNGASSVDGLYFPDVIIYTSRLNGGNAELDDSYAEDTNAKFACEIATADMVNTSGESLMQKPRCMRAVALLCDADGLIVNAVQAKVDASEYVSAVESVRVAADNTAVATYNALGQRVSNASRGLNIVRTADGRTVKVMRR